MKKSIFIISSLLFASHLQGSSGNHTTLHDGSGSTGSQSCQISYPEFEENVLHFDLSKCPESENVPIAAGFCRLAILGDKAFLYTFKIMGSSLCMTGAKEVSLSEYLSK